ncbi:MAG: hypothetical protein HOI47_04360 [Candidatus Scalindua sp.]|jgi:hypothetical protein|nr:hypothetical protein [Candidatus Scalindua sp.]
MLFTKQSKSFLGGVITTIILMVTLLLLSGCGDSNAPGKAQQERITKPPDPAFKDIGKTVLPSVEKPPDVN